MLRFMRNSFGYIDQSSTAWFQVQSILGGLIRVWAQWPHWGVGQVASLGVGQVASLGVGGMASLRC